MESPVSYFPEVSNPCIASAIINQEAGYGALLMQQLSRQHIDYVAHCIENSEKEFERLMLIVLHGSEPVVQRAAWAMDVCLEAHPELLSPYVETLINALPRFSNNGVRRQVVKALSKREIPEKLEGQLADLCFEWLQSSTIPVGVKVHCMQILANIAARHPDLAGELYLVINEQIPRNSAGFASRGRKISTYLRQYRKKSHIPVVSNEENSSFLSTYFCC